MSVYEAVPPEVEDPDLWLAEGELLADVRTGEFLNVTVFPQVNYVVPGLIPEGLTLLSGPPKAGKSLLIYNIAMAAAAGGAALGSIRIPEPIDVLYLALEDGDRRVQARARRAAEGEPIPAGFHYLTRAQPGRASATIKAWLKRRAQPERALVVIDTAQRVRPRQSAGANVYGEDYVFGTSMKDIPDTYPGMALIAVHHTRKGGSADFVESTSGSNGLTGSADTIMVLSRQRHTGEGTLQVTGRDIAEVEYLLAAIDGGGWRLAGGSLEAARQAADEARATSGLGDNSAAIVAAVQAFPGCSPSIIADKTGIERNNVNQTLHRLVNGGRLTKEGRGSYFVA